MSAPNPKHPTFDRVDPWFPASLGALCGFCRFRWKIDRRVSVVGLRLGRKRDQTHTAWGFNHLSHRGVSHRGVCHRGSGPPFASCGVLKGCGPTAHGVHGVSRFILVGCVVTPASAAGQVGSLGVVSRTTAVAFGRRHPARPDGIATDAQSTASSLETCGLSFQRQVGWKRLWADTLGVQHLEENSSKLLTLQTNGSGWVATGQWRTGLPVCEKRSSRGCSVAGREGCWHSPSGQVAGGDVGGSFLHADSPGT